MSRVASNPAVISLLLMFTSTSLRHVDTIILDQLGVVSVFAFLIIVAHHLTPCALSLCLFAVLVVSDTLLW